MGVGYLVQPIPIRGETNHGAVVWTDTREEGNKSVLACFHFVEDKRTGYREIQIGRRPLAASRESSGMNFVPVNIRHNQLIITDVDIDIPVSKITSPRARPSLSKVQMKLDRNISR